MEKVWREDCRTAGLPPQAGLPEGEAQLSKRSGERTCCRTDVDGGVCWTRGYLLWRKEVG